MTPKLKAKELYDKFYMAIPSDASRQCALIAVDEILQQILWDKAAVKYWNEVKEEIENL